MCNKRKKDKLPQAPTPTPTPTPGPPSQPMLIDDVEEERYHEGTQSSNARMQFCTIALEDIRANFQCPICLGIIRNTRTVMECLHRFCRDCIEKSFRLGNNECPACRKHCSSRRSLREDRNFDALIAAVIPDIDEFEQEELALSDDTVENLQKMRKAYSKTDRRQSSALVNKRSGASLKRKRVKHRRRRSSRNATNNPESSSSGGMALAPMAEDREVEVIPDTDTSEGEAEGQCVQHATKGIVIGEGTSRGISEAQKGTQSNETEGEAQNSHHGIVITDKTNEVNVPPPELLREIVSSSDKLVWGRNGRRSSSSNSARSQRLARLIDHLRISEPSVEEMDIFIKLVAFEEGRVPNLPRPYLNCKPTLSVRQLRQYVAGETSLETEEIEFYVVKEFQRDIVNGDGKLDPNNHKTELLAREEETLGELIKTNNLCCGHLVIAYNKKRWNLNEALF